MRAVVVREFGSLEAASLGEMPDPVPGPDQVLVNIEATAANFVDLLVIGGKYQFLPPRPFVPPRSRRCLSMPMYRQAAAVPRAEEILTHRPRGRRRRRVRPCDCYRFSRATPA